MSDNWKAWEGRTIDGKFLLGNWLGGSDTTAVFRTRVGDGVEAADAAIKLVATASAEAEPQLGCWKAASQLSHPNLIRILTMGQCAVEGRELVYVVEECAEENLAQIVPERPLTAEEVRSMLAPVLDALDYLQGKGLVQERIRPANILAVGDQVKLSSDDVAAPGKAPRATSAYDAPEVQAGGISTASEIWSLGVTLVEVLTQRAPAWDVARGTAPEIRSNVPEPFRGIAQRCLEIDPAKRCDIREIREHLQGTRVATAATNVSATAPVSPASTVAAQHKPIRSLRWIAVAALALVVVLGILWMRPSRTTEEKATSPQPAQTQPSNPSTGGAVATGSTQEGKPSPSGSGPAARPSVEKSADEIVERIMPEISASARRSITGKIKVRVRVKVDAGGEVEAATLKEAGPSKYFAHKALDAAGRWRFAAASDGENREWTLLFVFSRAKTDVTPKRAR